MEFVNVDHIFYKFSPGFHPHITDPTWTMKGKWNYHHMCYFWFKQVFELKIIQQYRYMMRLDDDSQVQGNYKYYVKCSFITTEEFHLNTYDDYFEESFLYTVDNKKYGDCLFFLFR